MEALLASETWFENFPILMDCSIPMREVIEVGDFDAEIFLVIVPRRFCFTGRVMGGDINSFSSSGNHDLFGHRGAISTALHCD